MDGTRFDMLARGLALRLNRRSVLRAATTVVATDVLPIHRTSAMRQADPKPLCRIRYGYSNVRIDETVAFDPATECCESWGVLRRNPISVVHGYGSGDDRAYEQCASPVPNSTYVPETNGCGAKGGAPFPESYGPANWREACNEHDRCYGTCGADKWDCDEALDNGIDLACLAVSDQFASKEDLDFCLNEGQAFDLGLTIGGWAAYGSAQNDACDCCPTCAAGKAPCYGECRDLRYDAAHCGGCGIACATGQHCCDGKCQDEECQCDYCCLVSWFARSAQRYPCGMDCREVCVAEFGEEEDGWPVQCAEQRIRPVEERRQDQWDGWCDRDRVVQYCDYCCPNPDTDRRDTGTSGWVCRTCDPPETCDCDSPGPRSGAAWCAWRESENAICLFGAPFNELKDCQG